MKHTTTITQAPTSTQTHSLPEKSSQPTQTPTTTRPTNNTSSRLPNNSSSSITRDRLRVLHLAATSKCPAQARTSSASRSCPNRNKGNQYRCSKHPLPKTGPSHMWLEMMASSSWRSETQS